MEKFNCIVLSWAQISDIAKKTTDKVIASDFHPDVVIAISRGGLVPARIFCDHLHVKSCFSIKVDHWGLTATKDGTAQLSQPLNRDLTGMNVLLVDDITDTGQSIELAKKHLYELNPKEVKTATLYHLNGSKYTPDYFGEEREWSWMIFPWNYREDLVNILTKIIKDEKKDTDTIKNELKKNYNVEIDNSEIEYILGHMSYLESTK